MTSVARYQFNYVRGITAVAFWLMETAHFGWNALPGSDAEIVCDGLAIFMWALAWRRIS